MVSMPHGTTVDNGERWPVSFSRLLGGDCDSLGGTNYGELARRNEFVESGVEFGLR